MRTQEEEEWPPLADREGAAEARAFSREDWWAWLRRVLGRRESKGTRGRREQREQDLEEWSSGWAPYSVVVRRTGGF